MYTILFRLLVDTRNEVYRRAELLVGTINAIDFDGTMVFIDIDWPDEEQFRELDNLLESMTGVKRCDSFVYECVIAQGQKVLEGGFTVEEATEEIAKQVQLYLAE